MSFERNFNYVMLPRRHRLARKEQVVCITLDVLVTETLISTEEVLIIGIIKQHA